ncbi:hypothetical protein [Limnofasciculus baicalensis]|uniref:DUF4426 domain-containing protein n=1 Tax=Limnofasciculus baicalensis BBK-W-15 TaxID=2699891 RepID=A0AAE3KNX2_9CYAN|nr:hypothetical protein [Limnofasciculus baicalensis]MCP2730276.1 hypothetical protein [Limnofasciculus baicalensis BBK-W-15]
MNLFKLGLVVIGSLGLFWLGGCGSEVSTSPNTVKASPSEESIKSDHTKSSKGGQVVETGSYHLELVAENEDNGTHLDLFLQKGDNHESVADAKVTGKVQLPDGREKSLDFKYDAEGKHYAVLLSEKATGEYQVKITADININGEKAEGRFSFNK